MRMRRDFTGMRFGMLTAVRPVQGRTRSTWFCVCDCGKTSEVYAYNLQSFKTQSCGCKRAMVSHTLNLIHGKAHQPIHNLWSCIRQRTRDKNHTGYKSYGAKGVTMCDEWFNSFESFYKYVGDKPFPRASIDRIDNSKGYEPGNVRWATQKQQCNNKTNNRILVVDGISLTISQWADEKKIQASTIGARLRLGWSEEDAVNLPLYPKR